MNLDLCELPTGIQEMGPAWGLCCQRLPALSPHSEPPHTQGVRLAGGVPYFTRAHSRVCMEQLVPAPTRWPGVWPHNPCSDLPLRTLAAWFYRAVNKGSSLLSPTYHSTRPL